MLTVIVATYNGGSALAQMLDALCALEEPVGGWRLILVDNESTDESFELLKRYRERLPLRILQHPVRGKNKALNAALPYLEGDLVVFTDDDVLPRPDWLVRLRGAADSNPGYAVFGGAIIPRWEAQPDAWLLEVVDQGVAYTLTDPLLEEGSISGALVWGPNMAVRSFLFREQGHRFAEEIGPRPGAYAMGGETEFNLRMEEHGHRSYFVPSAIVEHMIPEAHLRWDWLMGRARRFGRGYCRRWKLVERHSGPSWRGVPRYFYGDLTRAWVRRLKARYRGDIKATFRASWELNERRGMIAQARDEARRARVP